MTPWTTCPACNRPVSEDGIDRVHAVFHPECWDVARGPHPVPAETIPPTSPQARWNPPRYRGRRIRRHRAGCVASAFAAAALALSGCTASWTVAPLPKPLHVHTAACRLRAIVSTPRQAEPIVARDAGGVPQQIIPAEPPALDQAPWPEAAPPEAEDTPPGLPKLTPAVPLRLPRIEPAPRVKARGLALREGGAR